MKLDSQTRAGNPTNEEVGRLVAHYDKLAPRYGSLYEGNSRLAHFYKGRQACVHEFLGGIEGATVLEVGCGPGLMVEMFLQKRAKYWGADISPGMIRACRERFCQAENTHFSIADARRLPFPDSEFDALVSLGMLEYVRDEQQAVCEMARVLKTPGTLIVSGITKWSPYNLFDRLIYRKVKHWQPACIVHEYHTDAEYRGLLSRAKLTVVDVAYFDFEPIKGFSPIYGNTARRKPEVKGHSRLKRLGNGFVMKAEKRA